MVLFPCWVTVFGWGWAGWGLGRCGGWVSKRVSTVSGALDTGCLDAFANVGLLKSLVNALRRGDLGFPPVPINTVYIHRVDVLVQNQFYQATVERNQPRNVA